MTMSYFRIEADGAFFQAHSEKNGDTTLLVGLGYEEDSQRVQIHMTRNTAEMLARGIRGLAKPEKDQCRYPST